MPHNLVSCYVTLLCCVLYVLFPIGILKNTILDLVDCLSPFYYAALSNYAVLQESSCDSVMIARASLSEEHSHEVDKVWEAYI